MTKKHYIKFADLLKDLKKDEYINFDGNTQTRLLNGMIKIFKSDNSRFNTQTFLDYINK